MSEQTKAIDNLLVGLIDYAGLYPPAGLDMRSAFSNYIRYIKSEYAWMLGRFVVDVKRLPELYEIASDCVSEIRLSVIAPPTVQSADLKYFLDNGLSIDSIEIRADHQFEIENIRKLIPSGITVFFEVPIATVEQAMLDTIGAAGARVKLRTGGVVADAFPPSGALANILQTLANGRIPFKATAGLHHPLRGCHPLTYATDSPVGTMHGFVNLFLAATLLYFGGTTAEAKQLLDEESAEAVSFSADTVVWRSFRWTGDQLRTVRKEFAISFGSCSFEEPIHDLKALGWLL